MIRDAILTCARKPLTVSCFSKIQIGFTFLVKTNTETHWDYYVITVKPLFLQSGLIPYVLLGR